MQPFLEGGAIEADGGARLVEAVRLAAGLVGGVQDGCEGGQAGAHAPPLGPPYSPWYAESAVVCVFEIEVRRATGLVGGFKMAACEGRRAC